LLCEPGGERCQENILALRCIEDWYFERNQGKEDESNKEEWRQFYFGFASLK